MFILAALTALVIPFIIQSSDYPTQSATTAAAWSKNTVLDISTGACSGQGCITVVEAPAACSDIGGNAVIVGCAIPQADGSCLVEVSEFVRLYYSDAITAVIEHEVGHCVGLPHVTTDKQSIMVTSFPLGDPPRGPSAGDRKLVNAIYSP